MIKRSDLSHFFDKEAEAARNSWDALMSLPVNERIMKRKTIKGVYLDRDYADISDSDYHLLRVTFGVNLSDFKEGDPVILHREGVNTGIKCSIYEFEGDTEMKLEVFPTEMPSDLESYQDIELVLDKGFIDLRGTVFCHFLSALLSPENQLNDSIVNNQPEPVFVNLEENKELLKETIESFGIKLLPRQEEAVINSMSADKYYLVQGPPGTGKSFVLSVIILEEIYDLKHNVVVIGPNHLAINNVLTAAVNLFPPMIDWTFKVGQNYNAPQLIKLVNDEEHKLQNIQYLNVYNFNHLSDNPKFDPSTRWLIGMTPHSLYSRRAKDLEVDTLIIDEGGQMTIPLGLMGIIKAKKIIIAGDHKQLPPIISSDEIQEEMRSSIFQRLLQEGNYTILDTSFRMCEPICKFVSEIFYEGEVKPFKVGFDDSLHDDDSLYDFGHAVIIKDVVDEGMQTSEKEAGFIVKTVEGFLAKGIHGDEIGILTPFRAQSALIRRKIKNSERIDESDRKSIVTDTIDKMQGQERKIIFVSLTAGEHKYLNEMADFIFNPNKLNVAFSRAKSKLIIVGNLSEIKQLDKTTFPHVFAMLDSESMTILDNFNTVKNQQRS